MSRKPLRYRTCPYCNYRTHNEHVPPSNCLNCRQPFWKYFTAAVRPRNALKRVTRPVGVVTRVLRAVGVAQAPQQAVRGTNIKDHIVLAAYAMGYKVVGATHETSSIPVVRPYGGGKSFIWDPANNSATSHDMEQQLDISVTYETSMFGIRVCARQGNIKRSFHLSALAKDSDGDDLAHARRAVVIQVASLYAQNLLSKA